MKKTIESWSCGRCMVLHVHIAASYQSVSYQLEAEIEFLLHLPLSSSNDCIYISQRAFLFITEWGVRRRGRDGGGGRDRHYKHRTCRQQTDRTYKTPLKLHMASLCFANTFIILSIFSTFFPAWRLCHDIHVMSPFIKVVDNIGNRQTGGKHKVKAALTAIVTLNLFY